MHQATITAKLRQLFDGCETPGQAFDLLLELRKAKVQFCDVVAAIKSADLDHNEDAFECPNCGISRTLRDRCENPACGDYKVDSVNQGTFKNPVVTFGRKHTGKTLLEIGKADPGYLKWLATEYNSTFWREQAKMAIVELNRQAHISHDPDATGYFDEPAY